MLAPEIWAGGWRLKVFVCRIEHMTVLRNHTYRNSGQLTAKTPMTTYTPCLVEKGLSGESSLREVPDNVLYTNKARAIRAVTRIVFFM